MDDIPGKLLAFHCGHSAENSLLNGDQFVEGNRLVHAASASEPDSLLQVHSECLRECDKFIAAEGIFSMRQPHFMRWIPMPSPLRSSRKLLRKTKRKQPKSNLQRRPQRSQRKPPNDPLKHFGPALAGLFSCARFCRPLTRRA